MNRRTFMQTTLMAAPMMSLATEIETAAIPTPFIVESGNDRFNEPIKYRGINPNLVKISAKDTSGQFSVFEYEGIAKMGPELHMHLKQDEIFYVLDGEFLFQVGDEQQTLRTGDTIFLPRNIPHTWLQLSDRGKLMYMLQPAGKMEEFFKKMNSLKGVPSEAEVAQIHLDHDIKVVGPPLSLK